MPKVEIRKANPSDVSTMLKLSRRTMDKCYRAFMGDDNLEWFIGSGQAESDLTQCLDTCFVITEDDVIVGFSTYMRNLIHLVMIDEAHHRKGLGTQLLSHVEQEVKKGGMRQVRLNSFEANSVAMEFFKKNGWEISGKSSDDTFGSVRVFFKKSL